MTSQFHPGITDEEIVWACRVMGLPPNAFDPIGGDASRSAAIKHLGTIDYEACPGSGKTTLLVAKLAILANQWRSRRQGVCVLSHTNAARNEIGSRLSACAAGIALLRYPHFVGTIHSFVNEFLAMPWLRSKGTAIKAIDTDIALDQRWYRLPWKTRNYLERQRHSKYVMAYDRPDFTGGEKGSLGVHTDTYKAIVEQSRVSSQDGYFCYDEMFVWANELLDQCPEIIATMRERFPFVFVDEAQDNSELQAAFLHRLFCEGAAPSTRQRFGDSNQAIYQHAAATGATTDRFPGAVKQDLPRSYRFGQSIADIAKPFGVVPQDLVGAGPSRGLVSGDPKGSAILLFDDQSVTSVLAKYAEVLTATFSDDELRSGIFTAVAGVHDTDKDTDIPRSLGHYAPTYDPACARRESAPDTFAQHLARARFRLSGGSDVHPLVSATAEAVLHLSSLFGGTISISKRKGPHRRVREILAGSPELGQYDQLVDLVIAKRGALSLTDWDNVARELASAAAAVIAGGAKSDTAIDSYMTWPPSGSADIGDDEASPRTSNLFSYPADNPKVHIRLGSIHSVKGETHTATLVLDSYFHDHHLVQLKPWLLGSRTGGMKGSKLESARLLGRLKLHYVAMTRPTHMLCLGMRRDAFVASELDTLKGLGWAIHDCA